MKIPLADSRSVPILDDSSRKILGVREFATTNTANTITVVDEVIREYNQICPFCERIMDRGSEYGAHRIHEDGSWESEFRQYLESMSIRSILTKVRHPQTKGRIEKWFDTYRRFRYEFASLDDFISWYNDRPHGSLDFENLESPNLAFWRRLPQKGLSSVLVSEFFDGELMKNSRSYEQRAMRNTFGTECCVAQIRIKSLGLEIWAY